MTDPERVIVVEYVGVLDVVIDGVPLVVRDFDSEEDRDRLPVVEGETVREGFDFVREKVCRCVSE